MFDGLHVTLSWIAASAFILAFLLTLWTSPLKNTLGMALWTIGALSFYGVYIAPLFLKQPPGFEQRGTWIVPLVCLLSVIAASALFQKRVPSGIARVGGLVVFLAVFPAVAVLIWLPTFKLGMHLAPFGMETLGVGILWFRIREIADQNENRPNPEGCIPRSRHTNPVEQARD